MNVKVEQNIAAFRSGQFSSATYEGNEPPLGRDLAEFLRNVLIREGATCFDAEPSADEVAWLLDFSFHNENVLVYVEKFWRPLLSDDWWAIRCYPRKGKHGAYFKFCKDWARMTAFLQLLRDVLADEEEFWDIKYLTEAEYAGFGS